MGEPVEDNPAGAEGGEGGTVHRRDSDGEPRPADDLKAEAAGPGHDSGVEAAGEYASSGAPDPPSCASSLISCGSGCDGSFSCKTADRLDDFRAAAPGDGTSEGGSESSSVAGGDSAPRRPPGSAKKRVVLAEPPRPSRPKPATAPRPTRGRAPALATGQRARSRDKSAAERPPPPPPPGPKPAVLPRSRPRPAPDTLALVCRDSPSVRVKPTKTSAARCRTPATPGTPATPATPGTPPDEQRAPRLPPPSSPRAPAAEAALARARAVESRTTLDKYATLPRRRREPSPDRGRSESAAREGPLERRSLGLAARDRDSPPLRSLPPYPSRKTATRIRIYHETATQTMLGGSDVQNALAGVGIEEIRPETARPQRSHKGVQADRRRVEVERLEARARQLTEAHDQLQEHCRAQAARLATAQARLDEERADKTAAQADLQRNTRRVLDLLGAGTAGGGDGLQLLESQLRTSADVVARQQEEITKLHSICRELHREVETGARTARSLEAVLREQEREAAEMAEFLAAEKGALADALREAEDAAARAARELGVRRGEARALVRLGEQRRQEALALRARLARAPAPVPAGPPSAPAPAALPGLAARLRVLLDALVAKHAIAQEDLEDVIFHNEAFSRSASSEACSPGSPPGRPAPPAHRLSDDENSADLLDSETEPCLMMESVLEDVQIPDTYSHNLVSSCGSVMSCPIPAGNATMEDPIAFQQSENRFLNLFNKEDSCNSLQNLTMFSGDELSPVIQDDKFPTEESYFRCMDSADAMRLDYSENDSLHNLSQAILHRQQSEAECSVSEDGGAREGERGGGLVDQAILVDNLVTKLLKVLRIIQPDDDDTSQQIRTFKEKHNGPTVDSLANGITRKMAELNVNRKPYREHNIAEESESPEPEPLICETRASTVPCAAPCSQGASPRHSLADCNANSPQPINSAA